VYFTADIILYKHDYEINIINLSNKCDRGPIMNEILDFSKQIQHTSNLLFKMGTYTISYEVYAAGLRGNKFRG